MVRHDDRPAGFWLCSSDGVRLSARHDPPLVDGRVVGGTVEGAVDFAVVVAHGFTGSWARPAVRGVVEALRTIGAGVVSFDFRGHGASAGSSTVGREEVLDVEAAVSWARELGYSRVATLGFSMGAAVVVRHAALAGGVDAVVAVSGPSRWHYRGTRPMRLLHLGVNTWAGRAVLRHGFSTRVSPAPWDPPPEPPDAVVNRIAVPLLVVHGDADHYFPLEHALWLARTAGPAATLWIERGFGHAENAAPPGLTARIAAWIAAAALPVPDPSARMRP